ncbi:MAG TPA: NUDIX hydrolase [Thermoanaerobaculia bacterium]|jgi:8-oxo-dGTP pyrophosphatase MutT (NUDIX family)
MDKATELLEELRRYRPVDSQEGQHHRSVLDLLSYAPSPFSRDQFIPGHITGSCFIVDPASQRVLLHHHRRLDRWLQMGGHVEHGESALEAALREGREESGLADLVLLSDGAFDIDVHAVPSAKGEPDHAHFDIRYVARTSHPESIMIDLAESNELAWVELDRAIPLMNEEASRRAVLKIRKMLAGE